jgi:myo-inositol-1(or 4)-monophosphatase
MSAPLHEFLKVAQEAALAGGRVLLQHRYEPLEIAHKDRQEVVTNVDTLADKVVCDVISHYYPEHAVLSEESGSKQSASHYTWIVDPLDGTESYIRGQNFSSVTVALTTGEQTLVGVVYHPFHDELYATVVGEVTTINGHAVQVSPLANMAQARFILDYSPRDALRRHLYDVEWQRGFNQMFRIGGSVALNMCLVARGAAEGYLYGRMRNRLKSWDIAAAALLIQNAGGYVFDRHQKPLNIHEQQGFLLCGTPTIDWPGLVYGALPELST